MAESNYKLKKNETFGFNQIKPTPTEEEITDFYAKEFYSTQYKQLNNSNIDEQIRDKEFYDAHRENICALITQYLNRPIEGMDILDVGCGFGETLAYIKAKGANGYGFDPAIEAVQHGQKKGLKVIQAGMEAMDVFKSKEFDVVTMLNVLEHLSDPEKVLTKIRKKVMKTNGVLVIEVPNEFNAFQICGQKIHNLNQWWVAPPAHLNYFNKDSICKLIKHCGFDVVHSEASFPMELFLLFGENYVSDRSVGRRCHEKRMVFEKHLRENGYEDALHDFYRALASVNLGRQILAVAVAT